MNIKLSLPKDFYNEEVVPFIIDAKKKRLWAALLDLLAEFDRVCRAHNIKYSIDGGTILGKGRHGGIIPWDDDIDVIMFRSEYEKLRLVAPDEFKHPYFLQTMQSDPEAVRGHALLRNSGMTAILKTELCNGKAVYKTYNQGLFLDIFILDAIPDDLGARERYFDELTHIKGMMCLARDWRYKRLQVGLSPRKVLDACRFLRIWWKMFKVKMLTRMDPLIYFQSKFDRACRRYEGVLTQSVSHISFMTNPPKSRIVNREMIMPVEDVEFMGLKVMMVKNWEWYVRLLYGNWKEYVVGGSNHGGLFIDLDRPYTDYF